MPHSLSLLIVEDSMADAQVYQAYLERCSSKSFNLTFASTGLEGKKTLEKDTFDCILLDQNLPDVSASDFLRMIHFEKLYIPVVIITGYKDENIAQGMLQSGVADYLDKEEITTAVLVRTIIHAIERQKMLQMLKLANDSKEKFLFEVSNEIKRPLETLIDQCDAIFSENLQSVSPSHMINIVEYLHTLAKQQKSSLDELLSRSLINDQVVALNLDVHPLDSVLKEHLLKYKKGLEDKGLKLAFEVQSPLSVKLDLTKFITAFDCLMDNAVKFTESGSVSVHCFVKDNVLCCYFKDTGMGIQERALKKIFSPYTHADSEVMRRFGGLGNGLAIANQMIQLHGGTLRVKSTVGEGSEFHLEIPIRQKSEKKCTQLQKIK